MKKLFSFLLALAFAAPVSAQIRSVFTFPSGSDGSVQINANGVFGSTTTLTFNRTTGILAAPQITVSTINFSGGGSITSASGIITAGDDLGDHTASQNLQANGFAILNIGSGGSEFTGTGALVMRALTTLTTTTVSNTLTVGGAATFQNTLTVTGATVSINGVPYYYPASQGTSGQVLTTNGSGTLSWAAASGADGLGSHIATTTLNMANRGINNVGSSGSSFDSAGALTLNSTFSVTNGYMMLNGLAHQWPSSASGSALVPVYNSASGAITYQSAITDPARKGAYNLFTSSNVFQSFPAVFQEITTPATPASGYRALYAKSDGFYMLNSAGAEAQVGSGSGSSSWTDSGTVIYSTPTTDTVLIGTTTASESNLRFKVANGNTDLFEITNAASQFVSVSTIALSSLYFDVTRSSFAIPSQTDCSGFTGSALCWDSDNSVFYVGASSVTSGSGGGGSGGWADGGTVVYPSTLTDAVAIGTNTTASGSIFTLEGQTTRRKSGHDVVITSTFTAATGINNETGAVTTPFLAHQFVSHVLTPTAGSARGYSIFVTSNTLAQLDTIDDPSAGVFLAMTGPTGSTPEYRMSLGVMNPSGYTGFEVTSSGTDFTGTATVGSTATFSGAAVFQSTASFESGATFSNTSALTLTDVTWSHAGQLIFKSTTPATLSSSQNNWDFGNYSVVRASSTTTVSITGFANPADGRFFRFINVGPNTITLSHQSASSTDTNRIITSTGADIGAVAGDTYSFWYDGTTQRWRIVE